MDNLLNHKRISPDDDSSLSVVESFESYDRSITEPQWVDESFFDCYVEITKRNFDIPTEYLMSPKFSSLKGFINNAISKLKKLRGKRIPYRLFERILFHLLTKKLKGSSLEKELINMFIVYSDDQLLNIFDNEVQYDQSNGITKKNFVAYGMISEWGVSNIIGIVNI